MSDQYNNMVQWYYGGSYPRYWQLEVSSDNTPSWQIFSLLSGDITPEPIWLHYDELDDGSLNTYFRVIGVPYSGAPTGLCKTAYSNTLTSSKPSISGNFPTITQLSNSEALFEYGSGMWTGFVKKNGGAWNGVYDGELLAGVAGDTFSGYCSAPGYADSLITGITMVSNVPPPDPPTFQDFGWYSSTYERYGFVFGAGADYGFISVNGGISWNGINHSDLFTVDNGATVYAYCSNAGGNSSTASFTNTTKSQPPTIDVGNPLNPYVSFGAGATCYWMTDDTNIWASEASAFYMGLHPRGTVAYAYTTMAGRRTSDTVFESINYQVGTPVLTDLGAGVAQVDWGDGATAGYYNVNAGSWAAIGDGSTVDSLSHNDWVYAYCTRDNCPNSETATLHISKKVATPGLTDNHDYTVTVTWTYDASFLYYAVNGGSPTSSTNAPETIYSLIEGDSVDAYVTKSGWETSDTANVIVQTTPSPPDIVDNQDGSVVVNWGFLTDQGWFSYDSVTWYAVGNGGTAGGALNPNDAVYAYDSRVGYSNSSTTTINVSVRCGVPAITDYGNGTVGIDIGANGDTTAYQIQWGGWSYITTYSEFGVSNGDYVEAYTYDSDSIYLNSNTNALYISIATADIPELIDNNDGTVTVNRGANAEETQWQVNSGGWSYDTNSSFNISSLSNGDYVEAYCTSTGMNNSAIVDLTVVMETGAPSLWLQATNTGLVEFDFGAGATDGWYYIDGGSSGSIGNTNTIATVNGQTVWGYCSGPAGDSAWSSLYVEGLAPDAPNLSFSYPYAYYSGNTGSETVMLQVGGGGYSDVGNSGYVAANSPAYSLVEAYSTHAGWNDSSVSQVWNY